MTSTDMKVKCSLACFMARGTAYLAHLERALGEKHELVVAFREGFQPHLVSLCTLIGIEPTEVHRLAMEELSRASALPPSFCCRGDGICSRHGVESMSHLEE